MPSKVFPWPDLKGRGTTAVFPASGNVVDLTDCVLPTPVTTTKAGGMEGLEKTGFPPSRE